VSVLRRVTGVEVIDPIANKHLLRRHIMVTVPNLAAVPPIVVNSDLCAVLPEQWVKLYIDPERVALRPLPVALPFTVEAIWLLRDERDAGHRWLRGLIEEEFRRMHTASSLQWQPGRGRRPRPQALAG
jgi:DNA-binding transcriptional LysR family regulator